MALQTFPTSMVAGNIAFFPCTRGTLCKQNMKQPSFGLVSFGTVKEGAPCAPNLACQKLFPCCGCQGGSSMMMRLCPMFQCSVVIGCISLWFLGSHIPWWRLRRPEKDPHRVTHARVCLFFFLKKESTNGRTVTQSVRTRCAMTWNFL